MTVHGVRKKRIGTIEKNEARFSNAYAGKCVKADVAFCKNVHLQNTALTLARFSKTCGRQ